jgi:uncharacterized metal-binding protein
VVARARLPGRRGRRRKSGGREGGCGFAVALKVLEEAGVVADRNLIYDSLNRLAYRKAKLDRELR